MLALSLSIAGGGTAFGQSATPAPAPAQDAPPPAQDVPADTATTDDDGEASSGRAGRPKGTDSATSDIEVTGSRLSNGDPTTNVIVLNRADIERRGVTSVEDLIRTLPQNLATIGGITNDRPKGPLKDRRAPVSGLTALGLSAANLGGIGAGNTLVLVNGRRIAGAAGIEDGFVNLNGIPLAAIERVEISQNGASAVYGADAMGGVINFILRSNFTGASVSGQYEFSNNGANRLRTSAYLGKSWSNGNLSGTIEYSKTLPVVNARTGYVTEDYSDRFGGRAGFNFRSLARGLQPGVIDQSGSINGQAVTQGLTPRPGLTTRPDIDDFVTVGPSAAREYIARYAGPEAESISATYAFEQEIVGNLKFFSNGLISRTQNEQLADLNLGLTLELAPGQYYNPFPAGYFESEQPGTNVSYFPAAEIADGTLVAGRQRNRNTSWSVNAGLTYDFNRDTRLSLIYTRSGTSQTAEGDALGSIVQLVESPTSPNGVECEDFMLSSGQLTGAALAARQATFDRQCAALTSSDPNVAFNPWRSGAFAGGGDIGAFLFNNAIDDAGSRLQLFEGRLNGSVINLPAGRIQYALGGEYSKDGVNSNQISLFTGDSQRRSRHAFFGELNVPILGGDFTLPGIRSLMVNVAGRNDTYDTDGIVGTEGGVPLGRGGVPIFRTNRFSRFTPAYGFRWEPVRSVTLRGRWSTGFKAPPASQMFVPTGTQTLSTLIFDDPLYRCTGRECVIDSPETYAYQVRQVQAANPDLEPQTSRQKAFTLSWTPRGTLAGLVLNVTYNETKIRNQYAQSRDLQQLLPQSAILGIPLFYPRDATGKVIEFRNLTFNLLGSDFRSMLYELRYGIDTDIGYFAPSLTVVHNLKAERLTLPGIAPLRQVGFIGGPDRYRVTGELNWQKGDWSATLLGYYTPEYDNDYFAIRAAGRIINPEDIQRVKSYTTFDFTLAYRATDRLRINLAGRNIFDAQPPFALADFRPYDTARYNAAGRTLSAQATLEF